MKNITFSADEEAIERARETARERNTTLNVAFREWLEQFSGAKSDVERFNEFMSRIQPMRAGRKFTREEMNER